MHAISIKILLELLLYRDSCHFANVYRELKFNFAAQGRTVLETEKKSTFLIKLIAIL